MIKFFSIITTALFLPSCVMVTNGGKESSAPTCSTYNLTINLGVSTRKDIDRTSRIDRNGDVNVGKKVKTEDI